jgi:hypothetical protein
MYIKLSAYKNSVCRPGSNYQARNSSSNVAKLDGHKRKISAWLMVSSNFLIYVPVFCV